MGILWDTLFEKASLVRLKARFFNERLPVSSIGWLCESTRDSRLVDRCCFTVSDLDELLERKDLRLERNSLKNDRFCEKLGSFELPDQNERNAKLDDT